MLFIHTLLTLYVTHNNRNKREQSVMHPSNHPSRIRSRFGSAAVRELAARRRSARRRALAVAVEPAAASASSPPPSGARETMERVEAKRRCRRAASRR